MKIFAWIIAALTLVACARPSAPIAPARDYHPSIVRDQYGVPTIHGRNEQEAAYGLAMAHAEDNFRTIQLVVLASRGRLGAFLGADGAKSDFLWNLLDEELSVNELAERVELAQSPLSQHLSKIRALKLVATRGDGQMIFYRLASDDVARVLATLHGIYCGPAKGKAASRRGRQE